MGAAFERELPRDADEPYSAVFVVSDGRDVVDVPVAFPDSPMLLERVAATPTRRLLERAVEEELLAQGGLPLRDRVVGTVSRRTIGISVLKVAILLLVTLFWVAIALLAIVVL